MGARSRKISQVLTSLSELFSSNQFPRSPQACLLLKLSQLFLFGWKARKDTLARVWAVSYASSKRKRCAEDTPALLRGVLPSPSCGDAALGANRKRRRRTTAVFDRILDVPPSEQKCTWKNEKVLFTGAFIIRAAPFRRVEISKIKKFNFGKEENFYQQLIPKLIFKD